MSSIRLYQGELGFPIWSRGSARRCGSYHRRRFGAEGALTHDTRTSMTLKSLLLGAAAITAAAGIAGCGSSTTPTSTSSGTGTAPSGTAGSGASGNNGNAAANTLLTVADVQTISGD